MTLEQAKASGKQFRRRGWRNWWFLCGDQFGMTTMGGSDTEPNEIDPNNWPAEDQAADDFELRI